ncbi:MAG: hypothetical protein ABF781_11595, partial [Acetobacter orientalis]
MPRRFLQQSTLPLGLLVLLAGCIDVPHPFSKPDKTAQQLAAQAPPARLDRPPPPPPQHHHPRAAAARTNGAG